MSSDKCVANLDISRPVLDNYIRKHCIQQRGETDKFATKYFDHCKNALKIDANKK